MLLSYLCNRKRSWIEPQKQFRRLFFASLRLFILKIEIASNQIFRIFMSFLSDRLATGSSPALEPHKPRFMQPFAMKTSPWSASSKCYSTVSLEQFVRTGSRSFRSSIKDKKSRWKMAKLSESNQISLRNFLLLFRQFLQRRLQWFFCQTSKPESLEHETLNHTRMQSIFRFSANFFRAGIGLSV